MGGKRKQVTRPAALTVMAAFERFIEKHGSAVPSWLAADYLKMSPQGLFQAAERGWIGYFQHGRNRLYSYRDVIRYRWQSKKFKDNSPLRPYAPGKAKYWWEKMAAGEYPHPKLEPTDDFCPDKRQNGVSMTEEARRNINDL